MTNNAIKTKIIRTGMQTIRILKSSKTQEERFHGARKKIKETRALLRLLRAYLGESRFRFENTVLRDTARRLSSRRDAFVIGETLESLLKQCRGISDTNKTAVRAVVTQHCRRLVAAKAGTTGAEAMVIRQMDSFVKRWRKYSFSPGDSESIKSGFKKTYRAGLKRRELSYRDPSAHHFHEWRKSVKYSRHQLELMQISFPKVSAALVARYKKLGDLLGLDHDYAVIDAILARASLAQNTGAKKLRTKIGILQRSLRNQSRILSQSLYGKLPNELYRHLTATHK